jgi:hypothetical protein
MSGTFVTEVFVVLTEHGDVRTAGGTHSTRGSFFLTEKGAQKACWRPGDRVVRGVIAWDVP